VSLNAQRARPVIGSRVKKTPERLDVYESEIKRIATQVTSGVVDTHQQVFLLYNWVANTLDYDFELRSDYELQTVFFSSRRILTVAALKRKKTVCAGYAYIFEDLCKAQGIEVETIHGFTKKLITSSDIRTKVHHTWNAVKIKGKWTFVDITWAKSQGSPGALNHFWFSTSPQDFIKTHYPKDKKYTFLRNPISFEAFEGVGSSK